MNARAAKREAHRITADLISAYLDRPGDDDPPDWPCIETALRELEASHQRRGYEPRRDMHTAPITAPVKG